MDITTLTEAPEFWLTGFIAFELILILLFLGLWLAHEKKSPSRD